MLRHHLVSCIVRHLSDCPPHPDVTSHCLGTVLCLGLATAAGRQLGMMERCCYRQLDQRWKGEAPGWL